MNRNRGARDAGGQPKDVLGRFADNRVSWVDFPTFQLVQFIGVDDDSPVEADGSDPHKLVIRNLRGSRTMVFSLSGMTTEELLAFKNFLNKCCDDALEVTARLDTYAQEALDRGDDSLARLYRPVPAIHSRQRKPREHSTGVLDGHEGPPGGEGRGDDA